MSLGDAFPQDVVLASVSRQLIPGAVVKFVATLDDGHPKEKRFVVLYVDDETVCCVMNTQIHPIIEKNQKASKCQVEVDDSHDFVTRKCYIDCSRVRVFDTKGVLAQLAVTPAWVLGTIPGPLRDQIVSAIKISPTIAPNDAATYCDALSGL